MYCEMKRPHFSFTLVTYNHIQTGASLSTHNLHTLYNLVTLCPLCTFSTLFSLLYPA